MGTQAALIGAVAAAALALTACTADVGGGQGTGTGDADADPAAASATNEVFQFHSEQLAGNGLGASAEITVGVLLPGAYFTSEEPLPVVYFLPGYTATNTAADMGDVLADALDATTPMIVVTITGANELGGAWYTDSPGAGNWEQAIVTEIVPYIDANYRTIASAENRGLAGHSMGGYGAFTIAMRHADLFGSVFVMAPAIAAEGAVGSAQLFGSEGLALNVLADLPGLEGLDGKELLDAMIDSGQSYVFSYATAFSPTDEPPYFEFPYSKVDGELVRDEAVWANWEAGFGGVETEIAEAHVALASLQGIGLDCGVNDAFTWIVEGCDAIDASLTEQGIDHEYTQHEGTHTSLFAERMTDAMLPFFAEVFTQAD